MEKGLQVSRRDCRRRQPCWPADSIISIVDFPLPPLPCLPHSATLIHSPSRLSQLIYDADPVRRFQFYFGRYHTELFKYALLLKKNGEELFWGLTNLCFGNYNYCTKLFVLGKKHSKKFPNFALCFDSNTQVPHYSLYCMF